MTAHQVRTGCAPAVAVLRVPPGACVSREVAVDERVGLCWHTQGDEGLPSRLAPDQTAGLVTLPAGGNKPQGESR